MTSQLPLFDDPALQQLQAENAWLRTRLDHAKDIFRQQRADLAAAHKEAAHWYARCRILQAEVEGAGGMASDERRCLQATMQDQARTIDTLEHKLAHAENQCRLYKMIADMAMLSGPHRRATVTHTDLTQLLTLAHPDKWSQGQPATELAHELSVALNALRDRREVA